MKPRVSNNKNLFKVVLTRANGNQELIGHFHKSQTNSISLIRNCIVTYANNKFGAEMKDFRVIPIEGKMIPIYAKSNSGESITIEYPSYSLSPSNQ